MIDAQGVLLKDIALFQLMVLVGKLLTLEHCSFFVKLS
jgi:hypothetical protein